MQRVIDCPFTEDSCYDTECTRSHCKEQIADMRQRTEAEAIRLHADLQLIEGYRDHFAVMGTLAPQHMENWDRLSKKLGIDPPIFGHATGAEPVEEPPPQKTFSTDAEKEAYNYGWKASANVAYGTPSSTHLDHLTPREQAAFRAGWFLKDCLKVL
jgi:hypothetical protein